MYVCMYVYVCICMYMYVIYVYKKSCGVRVGGEWYISGGQGQYVNLNAGTIHMYVNTEKRL